MLAGVFVLKLVVLLQLRDHPLTQPDSGLDTTAYVDLAKQVLDGNWGLGPGVYYVSPFYIYFLAAGLAVLKSFTAVRVLQILLGTGSVGVPLLHGADLVRRSRRLDRRGAGRVHGPLHVLRGPDPAGVGGCVSDVRRAVLPDARPRGSSASDFRLKAETTESEKARLPYPIL